MHPFATTFNERWPATLQTPESNNIVAALETNGDVHGACVAVFGRGVVGALLCRENFLTETGRPGECATLSTALETHRYDRISPHALTAAEATTVEHDVLLVLAAFNVDNYLAGAAATVDPNTQCVVELQTVVDRITTGKEVDPEYIEQVLSDALDTVHTSLAP